MYLSHLGSGYWAVSIKCHKTGVAITRHNTGVVITRYNTGEPTYPPSGSTQRYLKTRDRPAEVWRSTCWPPLAY